MDYQAVETNLNTVMARVAPLVSEIDANDIREFVQAGNMVSRLSSSVMPSPQASNPFPQRYMRSLIRSAAN
jgi:hypothetical protein